MPTTLRISTLTNEPATGAEQRFGWLRQVYAQAGPDARPTLVLITQVYVPDPAAVGQYMHQAAAAMAERGYRVIVFAADSGYEDPAQRYLRYEHLDGVHIVRLPFSSFGKNSLRDRLLGGSVFTGEATLLAAALPRIDHVLISTSPPMVGAAGIALSRARRAKLSLWVMDINPDQIVAAGRMSASSPAVRGFDWLNACALSCAHSIVTLDAFMAERLRAKAAHHAQAHVIPPWPLFQTPSLAQDAGRRFRQAHGLQDKRVVMYSGNLSPFHPVDTLLQAMRSLRDDPRLVVVFVGGGSARRQIEQYAREHQLSNLRLLPYQPLSTLPESLSAADLHLVSMGEAMVGIVHPSKIYSAMAVGRPILALGPRRSHIADLVHTHRIGWHVEHGDVALAIDVLRQFADADPNQLAQLGARAHAAVQEHYAQAQLIDRFCAILQRGSQCESGTPG